MDSNTIIRFEGWIIWRCNSGGDPYNNDKLVIATEESNEGKGRVHLRGDSVKISSGFGQPSKAVTTRLLDKMRELSQAPAAKVTPS